MAIKDYRHKKEVETVKRMYRKYGNRINNSIDLKN